MPRIEIDRLSLNLSGLSEDQGRLLAMRVAEGLGAASAPDTAVDRGRMQVDTTIAPGGNVTTLANQIVAELVRQLNRTV